MSNRLLREADVITAILGNKEMFRTGRDIQRFAVVVSSIPAVDVELNFKLAYERGKADRPQGEYTTEEVAEILANLFCDEGACNYNGIDEWLPLVCKYVEIGDCPHPKDKHGCWMQYLIQGRARMKGADDENVDVL